MASKADDAGELPRNAGQADVLDLLIVGGGPGGTATAFRARELGIKALVVDYDDLMKRIRDYPKDKDILPDFGGGDRVKFPKGGDLISALRFGPIDKDEMCARWKGLYREHDIPHRVGAELTGLERLADGTYRVITWNHGTRAEESYRARHVVLSIGRGVPRRFDVPGNTDGIAYRLDDAQNYVSGSVCVIGGGTSAAEAVIAISKIKAAANDPCAVYWSYRGDKMPRVSRALADVFFEAYIGNGNIRYFPKSDPAAIVTGDDRKEYVSIRVDRRAMEGRPAETSHLEFAKDRCIACIGEDIPEAFLGSLGIHLATGGPAMKKRMVVNRYLETQQPNVYLVGDILSQAYLETDDFTADPAGFREIKHRGNVKSALRDGVYVAEVIRLRLDGRSEIAVEVGDAEDLVGSVGSTAEKTIVEQLVRPVESAGPPPESVEATRGVAEDHAFLVRLLPGGEVQEEEYPLQRHGVTTIGRTQGSITFPNDTMLSDPHASLSLDGGRYYLRDDGSLTGVFLRVHAARKREIKAGDLLQAGRQFLVFERRENRFTIVHYDRLGRKVGKHPIGDRTLVAGRQAPGITLDAGDTSLSRRHLAISREGDGLVVKDLKSANGTYLRVRGATPIEHGDEIRVGQERLQFNLREERVREIPVPGPESTPEREVPAKPEQAPEPAQAAAVARAAEPAVNGGPSVLFHGTGRRLPVATGQTVCQVAEENGIKINAECHAGVCGSDPVRILSGQENVASAAGDQESETLEDLCDLEPGPCRLACMLKVKGPVEVEIVDKG